jgi:hypothetical protein
MKEHYKKTLVKSKRSGATSGAFSQVQSAFDTPRKENKNWYGNSPPNGKTGYAKNNSPTNSRFVKR